MKCPKCNLDNPDDSKFCKECGTNITSAVEAQPSITKTLITPKDSFKEGSTVAGRYTIIEELGRGGMGVVYKAEDTKLKRTVALKFLPSELTHIPEVKTRFMHEAQAAAALDHPNICTIHEFEQADESSFISMAYIEGQSLREKLESGPLELDEALRIATQVAEGLQIAHKKGVVHRDIKSANIMVTEDNQAKIMDFGLAQMPGGTLITKEGMTMGTIAYMSPEQTRGNPVDHRTDIWSFGVVLYEMISGKLPFKGDYDQAVIYSILNEDPEPITGLLTHVPEGLERVLNKAMVKNPEERYEHINEMLIDLQSVERELKARIAEVVEERETKVSFYRDLFQRRIPQILVLYFIAGWLIMQFVGWLVNRFILSPHMRDFSFVALLSMIPTVLALAYYHGRPGKNEWTKVEKIGIPVNLMVSAALLFFIFQGKDLGAVTTTLTYMDEEGQTIERVIPKREFRKKIAIFFFDNESGDPALTWTQYAIPSMLGYDLAQDLFLHLAGAYSFHERMKDSGYPLCVDVPLALKNKVAEDLHVNYFLTGSISGQDKAYSLTTSLYETGRVKLIAENSYAGDNVFNMVDEVSSDLKQDVKIPEHHIKEVQDLPVSEIVTRSVPALKNYIAGNNAIIIDDDLKKSIEYLEHSVREDPTFALAYNVLKDLYINTGQKKKGDEAFQTLMQLLYKLPDHIQFNVKANYYILVEQDLDKSFNLAKMWVGLAPEDVRSHGTLAELYERKNQLKEAASEYETILELDPDEYGVLMLAAPLYRQLGEFEKALDFLKRYEKRFPESTRSFLELGEMYRILGEYDQAKDYYEKVLLMEPRNITGHIALADIDLILGRFQEALEQYQNTLKISTTPQALEQVYNSLGAYYERRGQVNKGIEFRELAEAENLKHNILISHLVNKLNHLTNYIRAGRKEKAFEIMNEIEKQLSPPFDQFTAAGYLLMYLALEDPDNAEKALDRIKILLETFGLRSVRRAYHYGKGRIHELRGAYEDALFEYGKYSEIDASDRNLNDYIGRCYRKLKEYKKAEDVLIEYLEIEPFSPTTHYELALVYWERGKKEKAIQHLSSALHVWEDADPEYQPAQKARDKLTEWNQLI